MCRVPPVPREHDPDVQGVHHGPGEQDGEGGGGGGPFRGQGHDAPKGADHSAV